MLMSSADYRESLRALKPNVFINGRRVESIAEDAQLAPGVNAIGVTYDYALQEETRGLARVDAEAGAAAYNRLLHITRTRDDLLIKLELIRRLCQETGCAMRYLSGDGFNALYQTTSRVDADGGGEYHARFQAYLSRVQTADLTVGIAMTDAKGDRSRRPHEQINPDAYVHIVERRGDGILISGVKAIVTSAPYVHELLVLPGRSMTAADRDYAVACAVPIDAPGLTMISRPAGRPGELRASFNSRYGQATALCHFERVFVPWEQVFLNGEWAHAEFLTRSYATHHRHSCIAARAGFGDLLIGAGALMLEANGLDTERNGHLREDMVELIKIVEGFYACGVAASTYGVADPAGNMEPEPIYANIGKLLLANQIYDMHRLAHAVSGGLVVTLPGPQEDHNPDAGFDLGSVLAARPDVPYAQRAAVARFIEDLTASDSAGWMSLISLHGGGSPAAMKREIHRRYPIPERKALVQRLLERGVLTAAAADSGQPGQCCDSGCVEPPA